jgi:NAD-dependent DNA ligase
MVNKSNKSARIRGLEKRLLAGSAAYYGSEGESPYTDAQWDAWFDELTRLAPASPVLDQVGSPIPTKGKAPLPVPVGSLTKLRPSEVRDWMDEIGDNIYVMTPKLDGQSILLAYRARHDGVGKLRAAYTRGDGTTGRIVTKGVARMQGVPATVKLPPFSSLLVRGEAVICRSLFNHHYRDRAVEGKRYTNARNFVGGVINSAASRDDISSLIAPLKRCNFIAYRYWLRRGEFVPAPKDRCEELRKLEELGFIPIYRPGRIMPERFRAERAVFFKDIHTLCSNMYRGKALTQEEAKLALKLVQEKRDAHPGAKKCYQTGNQFFLRYREEISAQSVERYLHFITGDDSPIDIDLDGVVVEVNDLKLRAKLEDGSLRPPYMRAVKLELKDQLTLVTPPLPKGAIQWQDTKRGLMVPVVKFSPPLDFKGVMVSSAYLDNYAAAKAMKIGEGAVLRVVRSGDVIPRVVEVLQPGRFTRPRNCPHCGTELVVEGVSLCCAVKTCPGKQRHNVVAFFKGVGVERVKDGTFKALMDAGFDTIPKLLALRVKDLDDVPGFQATKAKMVTAALRGALHHVDLALVMAATPYFHNSATSLAEERLSAIISHLGVDAVLDQSRRFDQSEVVCDGVGSLLAEIFVKGLPLFRRFWAKIERFALLNEGEEVEPESEALDGVRFVFTGYRDAALEARIEANGGTVGNFSSKVAHSVLFVGPSPGKGKTDAAAKFNAKIVSSDKADSYVTHLIESGK